MNNQILIMVIICIVGIGLISYFYFFYEVKEIEQLEKYTNVSISAEYNGRMIKTGFIINDQISGNTSQETYELVRIKSNRTIEIKNINIDNQTYYQDTNFIKIDEANQRIVLTLDKPDDLDVKIQNLDKEVNLTLYSNNFKDVDFCLIYSYKFIFVTPLGYKEIKRPEEYRTYDKCFDGNFSLIKNYQNIVISYRFLDFPNDKDYINISIFDKDQNKKIYKLI